MPSDDAAHQTDRPGLVGNPEQLQQAKRSETPRPGEPGGRRGESGEASPERAGVLGQLETERAHD